MSVILKAMANVQAAAPVKQTAEPSVTILKASAAAAQATEAPTTSKDRESAREITKEIQQLAIDAIKPMMMVQERKVETGEEQQAQEALTKNVTVIAKNGVARILKAELIAQELPKDDSNKVKDGTGAQIDGLTAPTGLAIKVPAQGIYLA